MDDNYSAQWNDVSYMGRGEKFYRYSGFDRQISLSWTVAAQSRGELIPMYQKLNYLASVLTPDFSSNGYMRGNLVTLTVGGYLYEQTGIITGLNYGVPQESPWEIAIPTSFNPNQLGADGIYSANDVKEMPHIIRVTGFNFIPIHEFTPRVQQNNFEENKTSWGGYPEAEEKWISAFGPERYIQLRDSGLGAAGAGSALDNYGNTAGEPNQLTENDARGGSRRTQRTYLPGQDIKDGYFSNIVATPQETQQVIDDSPEVNILWPSEAPLETDTSRLA